MQFEQNYRYGSMEGHNEDDYHNDGFDFESYDDQGDDCYDDYYEHL